MRETYFTASTIEVKSQEMRRSIIDNQRVRTRRYIPEQSALLVLDMQSYFLEQTSHAFVPSAAAIIPGLQDLINAYYGLQRPVIFTQHINTTQDAGNMATWWHELIVSENPLSAIIPTLKTSRGITIQKSQYDAFYHSPLERLLHKHVVTQVVISGVMTHLCCESTARAAFVRGFEVFFLVDGTATYHERFHQASLMSLAHGFATLSMVSEILSAIAGEDDI